jgi:imidazolonepropionase-like amidohydrolase
MARKLTNFARRSSNSYFWTSFTVVIFSLVLVALTNAQNQQTTNTKIIALTHVTVIDGKGSDARADLTVVIEGDRIIDVGPRPSIPKGAQVVNAAGKFLIPGLWDMHTHLGKTGEVMFPALLSNGVTSVREMGGDGETTIALREKVKRGELLGPRIKATGLILESPRFIQLLERITGESLAGKRIGVANADDAKRAVEANVKMGADFLKIRTHASRDAYLAIASEARRAGLPLVGHLPFGISALDASNAGQRSIEHGWVMLTKIPEDQLKETAALLIKNDTYVVPTLVAGRGFRETPDEQVLAVIDDKAGALDARRKYVPQSLADFWRKQIDMKKFESERLDWMAVRQNNLEIFRILHKAGVKMMAGTDLGAPLCYPGFALHDELELMVSDIGLTPGEALQSASRLPAEFMGLGATLGTIEKGKFADLVLLDANPLVDIKNTRKIAAVVVGGRMLDKAALKSMMDKMAAEAGKN